MTKLLEEAIREVEKLPEDEQDAVAGAVFELLGRRQPSLLTDEQRAEVKRRQADPHRKLLSYDEVEQRLRHLGF